MWSIGLGREVEWGWERWLCCWSYHWQCCSLYHWQCCSLYHWLQYPSCHPLQNHHPNDPFQPTPHCHSSDQLLFSHHTHASLHSPLIHDATTTTTCGNSTSRRDSSPSQASHTEEPATVPGSGEKPILCRDHGRSFWRTENNASPKPPFHNRTGVKSGRWRENGRMEEATKPPPTKDASFRQGWNQEVRWPRKPSYRGRLTGDATREKPCWKDL